MLHYYVDKHFFKCSKPPPSKKKEQKTQSKDFEKL